MKAIANTTIRLGLINLPVQVCSAEETGSDTTFNLAGPNGEEVSQTYVIKGTTDIVPKDDLQRGVRDGDTFHPVSDEAIDNIKAQTKLPDLGISDVVSIAEVMKRSDRIRKKYFIQMTKKGGSPNSMKLFVDALAAENRCLVTKWTPRSRQELLAILPEGGVLVAYALSFAADMREADEAVTAHASGKYTDAEMDMAKQLIAALADGNANSLDMEVDEALPLKDKLVQDAIGGKAIAAPVKADDQPEKNAGLADALAIALAAAKDKVPA